MVASKYAVFVATRFPAVSASTTASLGDETKELARSTSDRLLEFASGPRWSRQLCIENRSHSPRFGHTLRGPPVALRKSGRRLLSMFFSGWMSSHVSQRLCCCVCVIVDLLCSLGVRSETCPGKAQVVYETGSETPPSLWIGLSAQGVFGNFGSFPSTNAWTSDATHSLDVT